MFYLTTHSTHFIYSYMASVSSAECALKIHNTYVFMKEGNVLFNNALNTFYLQLYGVGHRLRVPQNVL